MPKRKKLIVNKDTIRALSANALAVVWGGAGPIAKPTPRVNTTKS
jgi:hypothetical protein